MLTMIIQNQPQKAKQLASRINSSTKFERIRNLIEILRNVETNQFVVPPIYDLPKCIKSMPNDATRRLELLFWLILVPNEFDRLRNLSLNWPSGQ